MNTGWICPRCNASNAPTTMQCPCGIVARPVTMPIVWPQPPAPMIPWPDPMRTPCVPDPFTPPWYLGDPVLVPPTVTWC